MLLECKHITVGAWLAEGPAFWVIVVSCDAVLTFETICVYYTCGSLLCCQNGCTCVDTLFAAS